MSVDKKRVVRDIQFCKELMDRIVEDSEVITVGMRFIKTSQEIIQVKNIVLIVDVL